MLSVPREAKVLALLSCILPMAIVPEVIILYPYVDLAGIILIAILGASFFTQILVLRLWPSIKHEKVPQSRRWMALSGLFAMAFVEVSFVWKAADSSYLGVAGGVIVSSIGFLLTRVQPVEPTQTGLQSDHASSTAN